MLYQRRESTSQLTKTVSIRSNRVYMRFISRVTIMLKRNKLISQW